jgi:citrate synthase
MDDALRWQGLAPGFGHFLYEDGDPRFYALLPLVERLAQPTQWEVVESVVVLGAERGFPLPNVDLAVAALTFAAGVDPEFGGVVFKIARVAGWVAHYLEELTEKPLRYRARAIYVTPK